MGAATRAKENEDELLRLGWFFYSPLDEWRLEEGRKKLDGTFVRGEYISPITLGQFRSLVVRSKLSTGDGRVFTVGTFVP